MSTKPIARRLRRMAPFTALAVAALTISLACPAQAQVMNGGFENVQSGPAGNRSAQLNSSGTTNAVPSSGSNVATLQNWQASGLSFFYTPQTSTTSGTQADNLGAVGNEDAIGPPNTPGFNPFKVWGPGNMTGNNGLTTSPAGGNFVALDGDQVMLNPTTNNHINGSISQLLTGLTVGQPTTVSFFWAAAQGGGGGTTAGNTNDQLAVSLCADATVTNPTPTTCGQIPAGPPPQVGPGMTAPGSSNSQRTIQTTDTVGIGNHGFSDWMPESFTFDPTNTNEVLSFLARGNPSAEPPMALLDGVNVTQASAPEPSTWSLLGISFAALGGFALWRRRVGVPDQAEEA